MSVKPRILMVIPDYPPPVGGGVERQAHDLGRSMAERGHEVRVICMRKYPDQPTLMNFEGVPVLRLPKPRWRLLRFPLTGVLIHRAMRLLRGEFDILHAHSLSWFGAFAVILARRWDKPVLVKLPTTTERAFPRRLSLRFALFKRCDAIALLSRQSVRDLVDRGFPETRILKVTNGVSTEIFYPGAEAVPGEPAPLTVLFSGRLIPLKGVLDLLAAWPGVVARSAEPVRLSICGEGPEEEEIRRALAVHGIEDSVVLEGRVTDMPDRLRAADVFVLPSYAEGNSNAVIEAMATGLPVLSTRVGGTPLLVGPDGDEWLVEPGDRAGLEERLVRLLSDPSLRRRVGAAMLARVREHLTLERVADCYAATYAHLAAGERDRVGSASSAVF